MKKIIEYKKIRGVYMRVDPTNQVIRISAPYGFPSEEIDRMVEQKKDFIDQDENPWIPFEGEEEIVVDR